MSTIPANIQSRLQTIVANFPADQQTTLIDVLYGAGFTSALQIAEITTEQFVSHQQAALGGADVAETIHCNAVDIQQRVQFILANIKDTAGSAYYQAGRFNNIEDSLVDFQQRIPDYQELFGKVLANDGQEFSSLYSPAAYFLDLMKLADNYISQPANEALMLENRRPDLWDIPLDIAHTENEVPYLQVVNEVMLKNLGNQSGFPPDTDPKEVLATSIYPFQLPYNLPLEEIRTYLRHFKLGLADIYKAFQVEDEAVAREELGLSVEMANLLGEPGLLDAPSQAKRLAEAYGMRTSAPVFNGTDGYVQLPEMTIDFSEGFTVEVWVCYQGYEQYMRIIDFGAETFVQNNIILFFSSSSQDKVNVNLEVNSKYLSGSNLELGIWTHLAVTIDANEKGRFYINGQPYESAQDFALPIYTTWSSNFIGQSNQSNPYSFNGQISDLRIWNIARTAGDIQENMYRRLVGGEQGLVGYWPLDERDGTVAYNWAAPAYTAVWEGSDPVWGEDPDFPMEGGREVLTFNGTDNYVPLPKMTIDYSEGFTVEVWVRYDSNNENTHIIDFGKGEDNSNIVLDINERTGEISFWIYQSNGGTPTRIQGPTFDVNIWYHLAVSIDQANNCQVFLNGQAYGSSQSANLPESISRTLNYIGKSNWSTDGYFDGQISDLRIWNMARSAGDIQKNMFTCLNGSEPGLAAYWPLNEGYGKSFRDWTQSGNGTYGNVQPVWVEDIPALLPLSYKDVFLKQTGLNGVELQDLLYRNLTPVPSIPPRPVLHLNMNIDAVIWNSVPPIALDQDMTIELWIYSETCKEDQQLIIYGGDRTGPGAPPLGVWSIGSMQSGDGSGKQDLFFSQANIETQDLNLVDLNINLLANQWQHIAVVRDAANQQILSYLDGIFRTSQSYKTNGHTSPPSSPIIVGQTPGSQTIRTKIAEIKIWKQVRSPNQIGSDLYSMTYGDHSGLHAYWPLNEGSGDFVSDRSGQGYDGIIATPIIIGRVPMWEMDEAFAYTLASSAKLFHDFYINQSLPAGSFSQTVIKPDGYSRPVEVFRPMNLATLDRIQRFIRLAGTLDWSYSDLDRALRCIAPDLPIGISQDTIIKLAAIKKIQSAYTMTIEEVCSLWQDMNTAGPGPDKEGRYQALFDDIFNSPTSFYSQEGKEQAPAYHPFYSSNPLFKDNPIQWEPTNDTVEQSRKIRSVLLARLNLDNTGLTQLARYLLDNSLIQDMHKKEIPGVVVDSNDVLKIPEGVPEGDLIYFGRVEILKGKGVGQIRKIETYIPEKQEIKMDKEWEIWPDQTSQYQITEAAGKVDFDPKNAIILGSALSADKNMLPIGLQIELIAGTGQGQTRIIRQYDKLTQVAAVQEEWDTIPDASTQYQIHKARGVFEIDDNHPLLAEGTSCFPLFSQDLIGRQIEITAGTGAGQVRMISDYNPATRELKPDSPWDPSPTQDSHYSIHARFDKILPDTVNFMAIGLDAPAAEDPFENKPIAIIGGTGKGRQTVINRYYNQHGVQAVELNETWSAPLDGSSLYQITVLEGALAKQIVENGKILLPSDAPETKDIYDGLRINFHKLFPSQTGYKIINYSISKGNKYLKVEGFEGEIKEGTEFQIYYGGAFSEEGVLHIEKELPLSTPIGKYVAAGGRLITQIKAYDPDELLLRIEPYWVPGSEEEAYLELLPDNGPDAVEPDPISYAQAGFSEWIPLAPDTEDLILTAVQRQIEIVAGKGKGQTRFFTRFEKNPVRIKVTEPFDPLPDESSHFVIPKNGRVLALGAVLSGDVQSVILDDMDLTDYTGLQIQVAGEGNTQKRMVVSINHDQGKRIVLVNEPWEEIPDSTYSYQFIVDVGMAQNYGDEYVRITISDPSVLPTFSPEPWKGAEIAVTGYGIWEKRTITDISMPEFVPGIIGYIDSILIKVDRPWKQDEKRPYSGFTCTLTRFHFPLSVQNLSLFYRYSKLSQILQLDMEDLLCLADILGVTDILSLDNVLDLSNWTQWLALARLSVKQLAYLLNGTTDHTAPQAYSLEEREELLKKLSQASDSLRVTAKELLPAGQKELNTVLFNRLVENEFISADGIVLDKALTLDALAPLFGVELSDFSNLSSLKWEGDERAVIVPELNPFPVASGAFECWVHFDDVSQEQTLFSFVGANPSKQFSLTCSSSELVLNFGGTDVSFLVELSLGWTHLALSWDRNQQIRLYQNGTLLEAYIKTGRWIGIDERGTLMLGVAQGQKGGDLQYPFKGSLAEVRLWSEALSAVQIQAVVTKRISGHQDGLIACWPLNEQAQNGQNPTIALDMTSQYPALILVETKPLFDKTSFRNKFGQLLNEQNFVAENFNKITAWSTLFGPYQDAIKNRLLAYQKVQTQKNVRYLRDVLVQKRTQQEKGVTTHLAELLGTSVNLMSEALAFTVAVTKETLYRQFLVAYKGKIPTGQFETELLTAIISDTFRRAWSDATKLKLGKETKVINTLSGWFIIDGIQAYQLLTEENYYQVYQVNSDRSLLDLGPAMPWNKINLFLPILSRITLLSTHFQLSDKELSAVRDFPYWFGIKRYNDDLSFSLPYLKTIWQFKQLDRAFQFGKEDLIAYLESPGTSALAKISGWEEGQLLDILKMSGFSQNNLNTINGVYALKGCFDLIRQFGVPLAFFQHIVELSDTAAETSTWPTYLQAAQKTLDVLEAKYGKDEWESIYRPYQGKLLETERDVVAAYLIWTLRQTFDDINQLRDLHDYLLIDVQMSSVMNISYVKEALNAIQLYIHRCRTGLELDVINKIPEEWWAWMSHYRVWEANRKVFLYPENYLDPSLRMSATPLFKELQQELTQSQITDDTVTQAYVNYIDKLMELDTLDIADSYYDLVTNPVTGEEEPTVFLFGRTRSQNSPKYYYRKIILADNDEVKRWDPWEKLDVPIHVSEITVIFSFGKLFVFWIEQVDSHATEPNNPNTKVTQATYSVKYSFQKASGRWTAPQLLVKGTVLGEDNINPAMYPNTIVLVYPVPASDTMPAKILISWPTIPDGTTTMNYYTITSDLRVEKLTSATIDPTLIANFGVRISNYLYYTATPFIFETNGTSSFDLGNVGDLNGQVTVLMRITDTSTNEQYMIIEYAPLTSSDPSFHVKGFNGNYSLTSGSGVGITDGFPESSTPFFMGIQITGNRAILAFNDQQNIGNGFVIKSGNWFLGVDDQNNNFNGKISELAILNKIVDLKVFAQSKFWAPNVKNKLGASIYSKENQSYLVLGNESSMAPLDTQMTASVVSAGVLTLDFTGSADESSEFYFNRITTNALQSFNRDLLAGGIDGLLTTANQVLPELPFSGLGDNAILKSPTYLDFQGSFGPYFWEIFFHIPYLIADTLKANQQFEAAKKWYEYIFKPVLASNNGLMAIGGANLFWQFVPFQNHRLEGLYSRLSNIQEISAYEDDPFDPFAIANLRIGAYEKAIVMAYINNLIQWGDNLFSQFSWETIVEATMLYIEARDILGPTPKVQALIKDKAPITYGSVTQPGAIPPAWLMIEDQVDAALVSNPLRQNPVNSLQTYGYFSIPENDQFLGYWGVVADRLFKIRHGENIEGIVESLALFQPPIDPNALIAALAAGQSLSSAISALSSAVPNYRFSYIIAQAKQLTSTLIQLGGALLSALEKKDAEQLALLRSTQGQAILQMTSQIKQQQIDAANDQIMVLSISEQNAAYRAAHYQELITNSLSSGEVLSLSLAGSAIHIQLISNDLHLAAAIAFALPTIFGFSDGGMDFGGIVNAGLAYLDGTANLDNQKSALAAAKANYDRRPEDWNLQMNLAKFDQQQIQTQITAAQIQAQIATQELAIHQKSIEQAQEIENYYNSKFTNQELYQWMIGQVSSVYFQTYQMAFDLAQQAQKAFQYERNNNDAFISFAYWDSMKKGLLSGEGLMFSLQQMEKAYMDQNVRRLEIQKTISLLQLDPGALLQLKQTGKCNFNLDEILFDYDFPGHYNRQIKTLSITIPAIVGPYQNVQATLTQQTDRVILKPDVQAVEFLLTGKGPEPDDDTLRSNWRPTQQIAISRGVEDAGLFQLNFQDERYLPFEGAGVVSSWELSMPKASNRIDFNSISDVIIRLSYTAQSGGDAFKDAVTSLDTLKTYQGVRFLSLSQEFSSAWFAFTSGQSVESGQAQLKFTVSENLFPVNLQSGSLKVGDKNKKVTLLPISEEDKIDQQLALKLNGQTASQGTVKAPEQIGAWIIQSSPEDAAKLKDILLIMPYSGALAW